MKQECPGPMSYHDAKVGIGEAPAVFRTERHGGRIVRLLVNPQDADRFYGDPRWPAKCTCDEPFREDDARQLFSELIYRVVSAMPGAALQVGAETVLREAPPGAMWFADWMPFSLGPDGRCLVVKTPGGEWMVDGHASNCTMPTDTEHRCWVRHGTPPLVSVDKNGNTCAAGAGSIQSGDYHGFLSGGVLT